MQLSFFLSLAAYACATTFSPGPNNVLLLSCGARYGFKKCLPLLCGIWTGLLTVMLLCGFCCALLSDLLPAVSTYARFVGAAYILWLGYRTLLSSAPGTGEKDTPLRFLNGFLLQFLNVKILMLGVAAYCSFILPHGTSIAAILIFAVTMAACAATGNLIWTGFGTLLLPLYRKYYRLCNLIMALLLFWCVYKILVM
jgi:cysteine/O-acetylserine efflux protein